jgi:prophage regulatory protein
MNAMLRRHQVETATGLSRATIYRMMRQGNFPRPVLVGERAVAWPADVILAWQDSRPSTGRTSAVR